MALENIVNKTKALGKKIGWKWPLAGAVYGSLGSACFYSTFVNYTHLPKWLHSAFSLLPWGTTALFFDMSGSKEFTWCNNFWVGAMSHALAWSVVGAGVGLGLKKIKAIKNKLIKYGLIGALSLGVVGCSVHSYVSEYNQISYIEQQAHEFARSSNILDLYVDNTELNNTLAAISKYKNDYKHYPSNLSDLLIKSDSKGPYLQQIPKDFRQGNEYTYVPGGEIRLIDKLTGRDPSDVEYVLHSLKPNDKGKLEGIVVFKEDYDIWFKLWEDGGSTLGTWK